MDRNTMTVRAWPPHQAYEEVTKHKDGTKARYSRHWLFGILVWDSFPKGRK